MKFCKYCGSPIEDGQVCNCENAVKERENLQQSAQNFAGAPYVSMPQASQNSNSNKFVDTLKNLPVILTSYLKNSKKTVSIAKKTEDIIAGAIFIAILFLTLLISNSCYFGKIAAASYGYIGFNFGIVLLSAFLITLFAVGGYVLVTFVLQLAFAKTKNNVKALKDSVISFGINSIIPAAAVLLGGLFSLFASYIGVFFFGVAIFWYVISAIGEIDAVVTEPKNVFAYTMVKVLSVTLAVLLVLLMFVWMNALGISSAAGSLLGML